ncbi:MAG: hypothetical protein M3Y27_06815 [Acidobacteriota bacterium]|nr:hypothetical protein [Acidobacteriota bacterium]
MARMNSLQELLTLDTGTALIQQASQVTTNGIIDDALMSKALAGAPPLTTVFPPNNSLATQLQQVAKLMQVREHLGMTRQIFFCGPFAILAAWVILLAARPSGQPHRPPPTPDQPASAIRLFPRPRP